MNDRVVLCLLEREKDASKHQNEQVPRWLVFLAYLAYLRAMRQAEPVEAGVLRHLIVIVGVVLVVVVLVVAGAPEHVAEALQHWPVIP